MHKKVSDGRDCDDGNPCTHADKCFSGTCQGQFYLCDDGLSCTQDLCDGHGGCVQEVEPGWCLIGGMCWKEYQENPGSHGCSKCVPLLSETNWTPEINGATCDDGDRCTQNDHCESGACVGQPKSCDDGLVCTEDSCDPATGECWNHRHAGWCIIEGKCIAAETSPSTKDGQCLVCDPYQSPLAWSAKNEGMPCDDQDPCTAESVCHLGVCEATGLPCDDGIECTDDVCTEGTCKYTVKAGKCLIGGKCYSGNEYEPGSQCRACKPLQSQTAWTAVNEGNSCDDGQWCTLDDQCTQGQCKGRQRDCGETACLKGRCVESEGKCLMEPKDDGLQCEVASCDGLTWRAAKYCVNGECIGGGATKSCLDGKACTTDLCEPQTGCSNILLDGYCLIEGRCWSSGDPNPENLCKVCAPSSDTTNWTSVADGTLCREPLCEGLTWVHAMTCLDGVCEAGGTTHGCEDNKWCTLDSCEPATGCHSRLASGSCLINQTCYSEGQQRPGKPCESCEPSKSPTSWTVAMDGTKCGDGGVCFQGSCCIPQCDGRECGDDGCGGTCGECVDWMTCSAAGQCEWDGTCAGVQCPTIPGYTVGCNAQHHCEYTNRDPTGWKQWDVWIYVPPGSFPMGAPLEEHEAESTERPVHTVTFAYGFLVGKYEVTVAQYEACMAASPSQCTPPSTASDPAEGWGTNTSQNGRVDHPQNRLTWAQANAVCSWLGGRLPSEAEWEYAATGPVHRKYPWGATPGLTCAHGTAVFDDDDQPFVRPWGCEPCMAYGCSGTSPVGTKPAGASSVGALDMAGNVAEWVEDCWHGNYDKAPSDGRPWLEMCSDPSWRVHRGGAFHFPASRIRSSARNSYRTSWGGAAWLGTRCVRDLNMKCGDVTCPILIGYGYRVSCNARQHCEYENVNSFGWRKHDVWVYVPPGSFPMGAPDSEMYWFGNEKPVHTVSFDHGFLIGKYEVTVEQYEACMESQPANCTPPSTTDWDAWGWGTNTSANGRSDHPQNGLQWSQAKAVCTWLGGRLPSEAEWEFAATRTVHRKYPWGDEPAPTCANNTAVFSESGVGPSHAGCGTGGTWPVGSKTAGASMSGALDMAGNVYEWVEDFYHNNYLGAPTDGSAWLDDPSEAQRVVRGGDFAYNGSWVLRSSARHSFSPTEGLATVGVRCLKSIPR